MFRNSNETVSSYPQSPDDNAHSDDSDSEWISTDNPFFKCTKLPAHYRCNRVLSNNFQVMANCQIPDGTRVVVRAGNDFNPSATMKNFRAVMIDRVAKFDDLRFTGKSGRGLSHKIIKI